MSLSDQLKNLEHLVSNAMGTALEDAERTLSNQIGKLSSLVQQRAEEQAVDRLHDAVARIDQSANQTEALSALLEEAGHYSSRSALFLTFVNEVRGWASFGFGEPIQGLSSVSIDTTEAPFSSFCATPSAQPLSAEECDPICQALEGEGAEAGVLIPLVLRNRVAAALYADRTDANETFVPSALALLVHATALHIESQGVRGALSSPALSSLGSHLELWDPDATESAASTQTDSPTDSTPPPALPTEPETNEEAATEVEGLTAFEPEEEQPTEVPDEVPTDAPGPLDTTAPETIEEEVIEPIESGPTAEPADESSELAAPAPDPSVDEVAEVPVSEATVRISREMMDSYIQSPVLEEPETSEAVPEPPMEPVDEIEEPEEPLAAIDDTPSAPDMDPYDPSLSEVEDLEVADWSEVAEPAEPLPELGEPPTALDVVDDLEPLEVADFEVSEVVELETEAEVISVAPETSPELPPSETAEIQPLEIPSEPEMPNVVEFRGPDEPLATADDDDDDLADESTVLLDRSALLEEAAKQESEPEPIVEAPAPPPPKPKPSVGSTQVTPPDDLEGPGWAFRPEDPSPGAPEGVDEETAALHEEARRLARLLVSEIKLYNEEQVEDGRRSGDIYSRLQDDIERSRQMYQDRVDSRVGNDVDYLKQELVNILAAGDDNALGM